MALHGGQVFEGDALMPEDSRGNNRRAVLDYERTAREYVATVEGRASATDEALRRLAAEVAPGTRALAVRSEENTSELQSPIRISYAVTCLNKKNRHRKH